MEEKSFAIIKQCDSLYCTVEKAANCGIAAAIEQRSVKRGFAIIEFR